TQGYGSGGLRNPDPLEIKYQVFSSMEYAINHGYWTSQSKNAGGLFFWRYGAADNTMKSRAADFISYFIGNGLDIAYRDVVDSLLSDNKQDIYSFGRYSGNAYYLFAINRTEELISNVTFALTFQNTPSSTKELKLPLGTTVSRNLRYLGNHQYRLDTNFASREVKVYKIEFTSGSGGLDKKGELIDERIESNIFDLGQNYPNPFNPATLISYSIKEDANVRLSLFDPIGQELEILVNSSQAAGNYSINFNAGKYSSGVYFYKIQAGKYSAVKKMIISK
ncbi:MAG: T9SS type A sorting domain-containing protein, partial [Ignavibacteriales bacterium]|nr:T9SS type A sorting domain-containing protein [Ignavibacteriales bacterium]